MNFILGKLIWEILLIASVVQKVLNLVTLLISFRENM